MAAPEALSISEIRNYMLINGCKVTNHALVKHFKRFLTGPPDVQNEARKQFKTYVNVLATIKNENNQKYLLLRKKYISECPTKETIERAFKAAADANVPSSPGNNSISLNNSNNNSNLMSSPQPRQPPPYKPPPEVTNKPVSATSVPVAPPLATGVTIHKDNVESYGECVQEFAAALRGLGRGEQTVEAKEDVDMATEQPKSVSRTDSVDESNNNKENIARFSFSSGASGASTISAESTNNNGMPIPNTQLTQSDAENENPISVKEATRKFNRMASEEEAKVISPPAKKKPENALTEAKDEQPVSYNHPKAKEWIVAMAKSNYQELAKLAHEYPELVRLSDPATGYTALHWAAKHGNEDVIKLIAGVYKADVNVRTNGGYTPLHLAMQFERNDIFQLLCNVYKANRDIMDWSGNKPLDYSKQRTSVSASTYSKIKARRKHAVERDLSFLRIGSLNVRVKKTTEAFSNFLGVGGSGNGAATMPLTAQQHHLHSRRSHHVHASKTASTPLGMSNNNKLDIRASMPVNSKFDNVHKTWGSADSIPHNGDTVVDDSTMMPPPKSADAKKRHKSGKRGSVPSCATDSPRDSISSSNSSSNLNSGYSSMPTTPNQLRSPLRGDAYNYSNSTTVDSDSDSACGFGSHWSVGEEKSSSKM